MNDLVDRLRFVFSVSSGAPTLLTEAADEIERLRKDAERLDWLQRAADARKVELAKSLFGTGYEIGEWPSMRVTVKSGSLRAAIDAALQAKEQG
jgi:hypothetical protein